MNGTRANTVDHSKYANASAAYRNNGGFGNNQLPIKILIRNTTPKRKPLQWTVSITGLIGATKKIFLWIAKLAFVLFLSMTCAILFWKIRAWIPGSVTCSHKAYVVWLDSSILGVVPSLWIQQHCRIEFLDRFLRGVWFSYVFAIIFGSTIVIICKGETQRHILSVILTLFAGLLVHYILPTQPPWMAVEGVIRIYGAQFTSADKNLVAAMPSIHQGIICLLGCALWHKGSLGRLVAVTYNGLMAISLVYLGEHFVVDSIAGIIIGIASWILAERILIQYREITKKWRFRISNFFDWKT